MFENMLKKSTKSTSCTPEILSWMRDIRRTIHRNAELSFHEYKTAAYIIAKLAEIGIDSPQSVAGTGVIADIGDPAASLIVGLRADMDALPVEEQTGLSFSSKNSGVMHACGHDGHVAMLLGAASILQQMKLPGRVRLLFQPAEEKGNGAVTMIEAGAITDLAAIFGGHIDTHYDTGIITVDEGIICAFADPFIITLNGSSGHAARPHEGKDAIVAAAGLITSLQSLVSREIDPNLATVLTVGKIRAGEIHNVIAGTAVLEGTIRSTHKDARQSILSGLKRMVKASADYYGVQVELQFLESLPAVINDCAGAKLAKEAAVKIVSQENTISQGPSSLGGEDFAFYLQHVQGCMVRFGARTVHEVGPAHSPQFDFDEAVFSVGAAWYAEVAQTYLRSRSK